MLACHLFLDLSQLTPTTPDLLAFVGLGCSLLICVPLINSFLIFSGISLSFTKQPHEVVPPDTKTICIDIYFAATS